MKVTWVAKIRKMGTSYVVTIPMGIANMLDDERYYSFEVTET